MYTYLKLCYLIIKQLYKRNMVVLQIYQIKTKINIKIILLGYCKHYFCKHYFKNVIEKNDVGKI